ncbi:hypothetical protein CL656_05765 [bacterium]|nr:hypothetical protein [bacterium]
MGIYALNTKQEISMRKFILCLLSIFTISLTAVSLNNFDQKIEILNLNQEQIFENKEKHIFEIQNNSTTNKLVQFEISNQDFILNTPYNIQINADSSKKIQIENLVPYSRATFKIKIDNLEKEYLLESKNSQIKINKNYLNFEDQILNSNKDLSLEIENLNKENIAIELKLSNREFTIKGRSNFVIDGKTKKEIKINSNCSLIGRKNANLEIIKGNQIIKTINLQANCTPDFENISFITNPPKKIDLGFVSNQSQKIQNYSLINKGQKKLEIQKIKKLEFFKFNYFNNKIQIELNSKAIKCSNCLIKETLILKTSDPYKQFILIPIQAYIYDTNSLSSFNLNYSLINPCLDTPKIKLSSNLPFNFEIYNNGKLELRSDMYLKEYILNIPCNVESNYTIKYETINSKGEAKLHTQNVGVISISKNQINIEDQDDKIFIISRKEYDMPLNLEIFNNSKKIVFSKKLNQLKNQLKSNELMNLDEGEYTLEIYNTEIKSTKKIQILKKK